MVGVCLLALTTMALCSITYVVMERLERTNPDRFWRLIAVINKRNQR